MLACPELLPFADPAYLPRKLPPLAPLSTYPQRHIPQAWAAFEVIL